jgi:hypothetical protein
MYMYIVYVIQLSDIYNVTFPAYDLYSLRRSRTEYILYSIPTRNKKTQQYTVSRSTITCITGNTDVKN